MISKTITLKFSSGYREVASIVAFSERHCATMILALMAARGAYGFGTQKTIVWAE